MWNSVFRLCVLQTPPPSGRDTISNLSPYIFSIVFEQSFGPVALWNTCRAALPAPLPSPRSQGRRFYCALPFSALPIASRKIALFPVAWGEKKIVTSSSKKVSPVEPRR